MMNIARWTIVATDNEGEEIVILYENESEVIEWLVHNIHHRNLTSYRIFRVYFNQNIIKQYNLVIRGSIFDLQRVGD